MGEEKFTAIVVGAGPAGCAAAYTLAKEGVDVLLVERGPTPGSKNMTGGRIYTHVLNKVMPEFIKGAPFEREVVKEKLTFVTEKSAGSFELLSEKFPPSHSFTVLRQELDSFLAERAEQEGAIVATGILVDELLRDGQKVVGIKAEADEIFSDVVIAADGVNSVLAKKLGLRGELSPRHVAVGVKQVILLSEDEINSRFSLKKGQGAANLLVGRVTKGVRGGGFLYTNRETISIGLVFTLADLLEHNLKPGEILEELKLHPFISPLVEGGKTVEYSAHLVPEGGAHMLPRLYADGVLVAGDAAGLVLNLGYTVRGMDLAILSGHAAAKSVLLARQKGDFTSSTLSQYAVFLKQVLDELNFYRQAPLFLETPDLYTVYPELVEKIGLNVFTVEEKPDHLWGKILGPTRELGLTKLALRALKGMRSL